MHFRTRTSAYNHDTPTGNAHELMNAVKRLRAHTLAKAGITSSTFFKEYSPTIYKHGQYIGYPPPITQDTCNYILTH